MVDHTIQAGPSNEQATARPAPAGGPRMYANYVVAAFDAPARWKTEADWVCDGADDQVEINLALERLDTTGSTSNPDPGPHHGGKVLLSPGVFNLTGPVVAIGVGVCLAGAHRGAPSDYSTPYYHYGNGTRIAPDRGTILRGLTASAGINPYGYFEQRDLTWDFGVAPAGVGVSTGLRGRFYNVVVIGGSITAEEGAIVENCHVEYVGSTGFFGINAQGFNIIRNNFVLGATRASNGVLGDGNGIASSNGENVIEGNIIRTTFTGIQANSGSSVFANNSITPVDIAATGSTGSLNPSARGIYVLGGTGAVIMGNNIRMPGRTAIQIANLGLGNPSRETVIVGNVLASAAGLDTTTDPGNIVAGNLLVSVS